MKKRKKQKIAAAPGRPWSGTLLRAVALWLLAALLIAVPLYMRDAYFHLIEAKSQVCLWLTLPAVAIGCAALVINRFQVRTLPGRIRLDWACAKILLVFLLVWKLAATWFSYDQRASFYGTVGWHAGSLLEGTLILCTLLIARGVTEGSGEKASVRDKAAKGEKAAVVGPAGALDPASGFSASRLTFIFCGAVALANAWIFLMAAVQSAGVDIGLLLNRIDRKYFYTYLATIGQKNSYAGYLCLVGPLFWGMYIARRDRWSRIITGLLSLLSLLSVILCESDSVYAGIGIAAVFMLPFCFRTGARLRRTGHIFLMYGLCLLFVGSSPLFAEKVARMRDLSALMLTAPCVVGVLAAGIVLTALGRSEQEGYGKQQNHGEQQGLSGLEGHSEQPSRRLRFLAWILELVLILAIAAVCKQVTAEFDDTWGTRRGLYWRMAWEYFEKLPVGRKITGIGQELLSLVYVSLRVDKGINVLAVHSEPLQILLTEGIVGASLYLAFWAAMIGLYLRRRMWERDGGAFFFPLAAYLGQSLFCSVYPVTAAVFSAMAGLFLAEVRRGSQERA